MYSNCGKGLPLFILMSFHLFSYRNNTCLPKGPEPEQPDQPDQAETASTQGKANAHYEITANHNSDRGTT